MRLSTDTRWAVEQPSESAAPYISRRLFAAPCRAVATVLALAFFILRLARAP